MSGFMGVLRDATTDLGKAVAGLATPKGPPPPPLSVVVLVGRLTVEEVGIILGLLAFKRYMCLVCAITEAGACTESFQGHVNTCQSRGRRRLPKGSKAWTPERALEAFERFGLIAEDTREVRRRRKRVEGLDL